MTLPTVFGYFLLLFTYAIFVLTYVLSHLLAESIDTLLDNVIIFKQNFWYYMITLVQKIFFFFKQTVQLDLEKRIVIVKAKSWFNFKETKIPLKDVYPEPIKNKKKAYGVLLFFVLMCFLSISGLISWFTDPPKNADDVQALLVGEVIMLLGVLISWRRYSLQSQTKAIYYNKHSGLALFELLVNNPDKARYSSFINKLNLAIQPNKQSDLPLHSDEERTQTFINSVKNNDLILTEQLIKHGLNVNMELPFNESLLFIATLKGYAEIVDMLLAAGADYKIKNTGNHTLMHAACRGGNLGIVKKFLQLKLSLYDRTRFSILPVFFAIKKGHVDIVEYFFANRLLQLNDKDEKRVLNEFRNYIPAYKPALELILDNISLTKELAANILLRTALSACNLELVKFIYFRFPFIKECLPEVIDSIFCCIQSNFDDYFDSVEQIDIPELVSAKCYSTITSFKSYANPVYEFLLQNGFTYDLLNKNDETLLHYAASTEAGEYDDHYELACLICLGYPIDITNSQNETPLHYALKKGYFYHAILLIYHGANLNLTDNTGMTALDHAKKFVPDGIGFYGDEPYDFNEEDIKPYRDGLIAMIQNRLA